MGRVTAHELVDVLEARVVPHVEDHAPVGCDGQGRALVAQAAHRGVLHGRPRRVERVDLDHPAEAIRLVRVARGIEALVELVPAVPTAPLGDAVTPLPRGHAAGAVDEVELKVLLAGEIGPPRGVAHRAVAHGPERSAAGRIGGGLHPRVPGGRPGEPHRRRRGDPARVARRAHQTPAVSIHPHLDHRDAVGRLRLPHLLGGPRQHAVRVEQAVVGVLVVHGEQPVGRAGRAGGERKEAHAVVMHAGLAELIVHAVARVGLEARAIRDWIAPGIEDRRDVTARDHQGVGRRHRHAGEAERALGPGRRPQPSQAGRRQTGGQEAPARQPRLEHVGEDGHPRHDDAAINRRPWRKLREGSCGGGLARTGRAGRRPRGRGRPPRTA